MTICANSPLNSCNSRIIIEAHSLRSHQLADHFPLSLQIKADLYPFKTLVLKHLCPGFVKYFHKTHLREHSSGHMLSICHNSPTDFHIFRSSMSQISFGQTRSPFFTMYHLSCIIHHQTPIMNHLSSNTYHASPIIIHLSSSAYHPSSVISLHLHYLLHHHHHHIV